MTSQGNGNVKYAVAIRNGGPFLYLRITRHATGDVYVVHVTHPAFRKRALHASYHADGWYHLKSYGHRLLIRRGSRPDANFRDPVTFWGMSIAAGDGFATPCNPADFDEVFEIPMSSLSASTVVRRTQLEVSLVGPGELPVPSWGNVLWHRRYFRDRVPWIVVSLYDCSWIAS